MAFVTELVRGTRRDAFCLVDKTGRRFQLRNVYSWYIGADNTDRLVWPVLSTNFRDLRWYPHPKRVRICHLGSERGIHFVYAKMWSHRRFEHLRRYGHVHLDA
jgi:hypothetical protein